MAMSAVDASDVSDEIYENLENNNKNGQSMIYNNDHGSTEEDHLYSDDSIGDKTYNPNGDTSDTSEFCVDTIKKDAVTKNSDEHNTSTSSEESTEETRLVKSRKRKRNTEKWKSYRRKLLRNSGKIYKTTTGKINPAKFVQAYEHVCRFECNKITEESRQLIHDEYWKTASWQAQTNFIRNSVRIMNPKRHVKNTVNKKTKSTNIYLDNKRVCKQFFLKTLNISNRRFSNAALKEVTVPGLSPVDHRGRHAPSTKISEDVLQHVRDHINSFPKFRSHYSRKDAPNRKYLPPELTVSKMYGLYRDKCNETNKIPVKEPIYRRVFNTDFNLSFYKLRSDTCNTCDRLENSIKAETNTANISKLKAEKELHLRKVDAAREAKKHDIKCGKESKGKVKVITFDLQKTLPTPMLNTNLIFYKRQLWTYNFGIHDCQTNLAYMNMWSEDIASRGASEIGSCLLKYVYTLPEETTHIIAYSDSCGGQNRNQVLSRMWFFIVANTRIETVDHKYLVSGHSYLENDSDFSHIEKLKKKTQYIYIPDDWMKLVASAQKRFQVVKMQSSDFLSTEPIAKCIINRKVDTEKQKVSWLKMRWIQYRKSSPKTLYFKETLNKDFEFREINMNAASRSKIPDSLPVLRDDPIKLKAAKAKDLESLLSFIPPIHHLFYKTIIDRSKNTINLGNRLRGRPRKTIEEKADSTSEDESVICESDISDSE